MKINFYYYFIEKQMINKKLRPLPLIIILLILSAFTSFGQTGKGTISGVIKDSSGAQLPHVSINLKGTNKGTFTDAQGKFVLKNAPEGNQTVLIQMFGYKQIEKQVEVKAGENTEISTVSLSHDVSELGEVVIDVNRNKYNIEDPSSSLRLQTPILEIPQNIQVVTNDVLKEQQIISMSDGLVRNVSGLVRAEHWGDLYTNIVTRGSQIQAFRNGFNVVNSYWGPLTEDMSFVDHIEFVKGPASFMLASGDPSGLYNVVTKKPTGETKGEASIVLGSFNLYRTTLDLDGKLSNNGKLLYRLNLAAQNKQTHRDNEYNDRYVIAPVISYQLDEKTKLTAEYTYQRANMSNVGSYYMFSPDGFATLPADFTVLPAGTPGTKINDHSFYLNLQHDFNKNWKITGQVSRFVYKQEGYSMWPSAVNADGTIIRKIGLWDAESRMKMAQVFVNGDVKTGFIRHRILGGIDLASKEYLADWNQSHNLDTVGAEFDPRNPDLTPSNGYPVFDRSKSLEERAYASDAFQTQSYASIYLQDELGFLDNKIRLTLAGRYTTLKQAYYGSDSSRHFTPRVGLSVSIDKNTSVYALYDQAFIPQTGNLTNGKNVQPITGNNKEIGIKRDWFDGKWSTTLAFYHIVKNNELTPDPTQGANSNLSIELGQKVSKGIEFDLRGTIVKGLDLIANYAYTDSRVTKVAEGVNVDIAQEGDVVPGFAKHVINGWLNYKLENGILKGLGVSAGCSWYIDRATYWEASPDPSKEMKDYFKVDGGLFWDNGKIRISANVFNLLDTYLYSGSYYSDYFATPAYSWQSEAPRNFRLAVNYKF